MNDAEVALPNDVALCHELIRQQADSLQKARLPTHPADRLCELLPDAWLADHPQARRKVAS